MISKSEYECILQFKKDSNTTSPSILGPVDEFYSARQKYTQIKSRVELYTRGGTISIYLRTHYPHSGEPCAETALTRAKTTLFVPRLTK